MNWKKLIKKNEKKKFKQININIIKTKQTYFDYNNQQPYNSKRIIF